jgi:beta-lactam-binding protein with PASTA domain
VLVSLGPHDPAYVMPHLVGMSEAEGQRRLDAAGLHHKLNYVTAPQWPHGAIIDQAPLAGARLASNANVDLTVAN